MSRLQAFTFDSASPIAEAAAPIESSAVTRRTALSVALAILVSSVTRSASAAAAMVLNENTSVLVVAQFVVIKLERIADPVQSIYAQGYHAPGDGGAGWYRRRSTPPIHPGKVQSADGAWWELDKDDIRIEQFGAVAIDDSESGLHHDSTQALQDAIDFVAARGGGDIFVAGGRFEIARPIMIRNHCTLIGDSDLEGGGAALVVGGSHVFEFPAGGEYTPALFSMRRVRIDGRHRGQTDFVRRPNGGSWGWGTIEGCYFVNLRNFHLLLTGLHVLNNNFQNVASIEIRGSDAAFSYNYANFDEQTSGVNEDGALCTIVAASAIDFSHNYFTSFSLKGAAPRVLEIRNSRQVRVINNQLDGGDRYALAITDGCQQIVVSTNRLIGYRNNVTFLVSNSTDIVVRENFVQGLKKGAGFIEFVASPARVRVVDNITNSRGDESTHDYVACPSDADVQMSGFGLAVVNATANMRIPSAGFDRTYTNSGCTLAEQTFRICSASARPGRTIRFARLSRQSRLLVVDEVSGKMLYDSSAAGTDRCVLACYVTGSFIREM